MIDPKINGYLNFNCIMPMQKVFSSNHAHRLKKYRCKSIKFIKT